MIRPIDCEGKMCDICIHWPIDHMSGENNWDYNFPCRYKKTETETVGIMIQITQKGVV